MKASTVSCTKIIWTNYRTIKNKEVMQGYYFRLYDKKLPIKTIFEGIIPTKEYHIYTYHLLSSMEAKEIRERYKIPYIGILEDLESESVGIEGFYIEIESEEIKKFRVNG